MNLGGKLAQARTERGLTQQEAAERLGVSQQTIADWEGGQVRPDPSALSRLSSLYGLALDDCVQDNAASPDQAAVPVEDDVKKPRISRRTIVGIYLVILALLIIVFWVRLRPGDDALGFGILAFYFVLPAATLVLSALIGRTPAWGKGRWLMILFFGIIYMLAQYGTFSLASMLSTGTFRLPSVTVLAAGLLLSAVGMIIGAALYQLEAQDKLRASADQDPSSPE